MDKYLDGLSTLYCYHDVAQIFSDDIELNYLQNTFFLFVFNIHNFKYLYEQISFPYDKTGASV